MLFALFLYVPFTCMCHLHVCTIFLYVTFTRIMYCACVVSFVVVQIKYNVKRLELFKIRHCIKCSLLLLLSLFASVHQMFWTGVIFGVLFYSGPLRGLRNSEVFTQDMGCCSQ